ncbi:MAG: HAMP domain-containing histidine kinase [Cyclobacteriaceae bacterium]|nr:HAMP domain-containing histidine kinase [Cyclobacteriaceae bacterium]
MKKSLNKLLLILLAVLLLPMVLFTAYQISNLNENEKVLTEIYDNQLDAILFSVNQYSQDLVDAWGRDLTMAVENDALTEEAIDLFLQENEAISYIMLADTTLEKVQLWTLLEDDPEIVELLQDSLRRNMPLIKKLQTYRRGGYFKKEPWGRINPGSLIDQSSLMFLLNADVEYQICLLVMDPGLFITQNLAQRIQAVTQENFIISAYNDRDNTQIVVSDTIRLESPQKKPLWLLPDYSLGIVLKGETIQALARKRTTNNLLILLGVNAILIFGLWLIYRNIQKEVKLAKIKSDFVSNVSHEIRTPLALISMFAETLEMNRVPSEEKRQEYYHIIGQEANRLGGIVNKILSFSKMEAGKVQYRLEKTNLSEIVKEILDTYEYHLKSQGFSCDFHPNGSLPQVSADKDAVSEAIINLLDNAIKYSDKSHTIKVTLGMQDQWAFVEVQDFGLGISTQDQKYIFDKFYRVPSGSVHNTKGTGLGLTLVSHIMEAHGGSVQLESNPGKGSKFRLLFPTITDESIL